MESTASQDADLSPAPGTTTGVLLIVNTGDDNPSRACLEYAIAVAERDGAALTIYDRAEETWGDSQHPDGPMELDDDRLDDRAALRQLLQIAREKDVQVQGWVSTLPSLSAVTSALASLDANLVVVPGDLSRKLLERALSGDSIAESLATQIARNPTLSVSVVTVDDDGSRSLAEPSN